MTKFTNSIAVVAGVSEEEAVKIQNFMDNWLELDYSEMTAAKLKREVKCAIQMMNDPKFAAVIASLDLSDEE